MGASVDLFDPLPPPHRIGAICLTSGRGGEVQRAVLISGRYGRHQPPRRRCCVDLLSFSVPR